MRSLDQTKTVYVFLQLLTCGILSLYLFSTYTEYPGNIIWYFIAIGLGILGFLRQRPIVSFTALVVVIVYGLRLLYKIGFGDPTYFVNGNDILWLLFFPFTAIVGGLQREDWLPRLKGREHRSVAELDQMEAQEEAPQMELEQGLPFQTLTREQLVASVDEQIDVYSRERRTFALLFVRVERLQPFGKHYGNFYAREVIHRTAEMIHVIVPPQSMKFYLPNEQFVVLLPEHDLLSANLYLLRLENRFVTMFHRSRNDKSTLPLFVFSTAGFPVDGLTAEILLQKAESEMKVGIKDVEN